MLQEELSALARAPLDRSLDGLESGIWRVVEAKTSERRAYRGIVTMQLVILAIGVAGSLGFGRQWATTHNAAGPHGVFSPYTRLVASNLLVGEPR
ncbi:MAG: hypothetical protein KGL25_11610 [Gammaproteobacteria bacterium]|nr:hypothetical protein [Gammaproteobacteria bacterium]